ncbi:MAG: lytic transglycosylase domain-containing protein [Planctomycetota bacterium]
MGGASPSIRRTRWGHWLLLGLVLIGNGVLYAEWIWRDAWPALRLRAHEAALTRAAHDAGLPRGLVQAVAIQESRGDPGARSHADAIGLMQLRLETAREIGASLGVTIDGEERLEDPALNLRLGCQYLAGLLRRFEGDLVLALAAYNSGPTRVSGWIEGSTNYSSRSVVEARAPGETRRFVRSVLDRWRRIRYAGGWPVDVPPAQSREKETP